MKNFLRLVLPASLLRRRRIRRFGRFTVLKWETDGLLPEATYAHLHASFRDAPDNDIVEVGGASGAASIAVALALKETRKQGRLIVVEKFEGGTRDAFGGHRENLARFWSFLKLYGVADYIRLWDGFLTEENSGEVRRLVKTPELAGLILDADGRIHRDLQAFWDLITPDTLIYIDDVHPTLATKHALTHRLVTHLIEAQLVKKTDAAENTWIMRRTCPAGTPFPYAKCQEIFETFCRENHVAFEKAGIVDTSKG